MSNDINLLPHTKKGALSQEQVLSYLKISALISCVLTVSLAIILFLLNRDPSVPQIQAQQQTILAQLNLLHSKTAKNLIILDRVKRITKILQSRVSLDKKIAEIQKQIPSGVTVSSFSLDDKHMVIALSAQSLSPLGIFIENMTHDVTNKVLVKKITIQGVVSDEKNGTFLLNITGDLL